MSNTCAKEIDVTRVLCAEADLREDDTRSFSVGSGDWPLRGFLVRTRGCVHAYVNHCPHAGHPLNLRPNEFLTADRTLILCNSHGALFEKQTGLCVAGPCVGQSLQRVPIRIEAGLVILADENETA